MGVDSHDVFQLIQSVYVELEKKFAVLNSRLDSIESKMSEPMGVVDRRRSQPIIERMQQPVDRGTVNRVSNRLNQEPVQERDSEAVQVIQRQQQLVEQELDDLGQVTVKDVQPKQSSRNSFPQILRRNNKPAPKPVEDDDDDSKYELDEKEFDRDDGQEIDL